MSYKLNIFRENTQKKPQICIGKQTDIENYDTQIAELTKQIKTKYDNFDKSTKKLSNTKLQEMFAKAFEKQIKPMKETIEKHNEDKQKALEEKNKAETNFKKLKEDYETKESEKKLLENQQKQTTTDDNDINIDDRLKKIESEKSKYEISGWLRFFLHVSLSTINQFLHLVCKKSFKIIVLGRT